MIRLAFCGSSGTGKSTLATAVAATLKLPMCPVGSREVSKSMGFESPYDVDRAGKRGEFQQLLLHQKKKWERDHCDAGFITDRTHLDNLAYTIEHDPALGAEPGFRFEVEAAMLIYTRIVFCPLAAVHNTAGDPARVAELEYHRRFEAVLVDLFGKLLCGVPVLWLTTGHHESRVKQVMRFAL